MHRALIPLALALMIPPALAAEPSVVPSQVPAQGRQAALIHVDEFGRYAITATSEQGTALQLVDRMIGPRERDGRQGQEDGRLDLFLDQGDYRLLTQAHPLGTGEAQLQVRPFTELQPDSPLLTEDLLVSSELGDLRQRSWWVHVPERRYVAIEAGGRALADLRLWQDGSWLVGVEPSLSEETPVKGQPLRVARLQTWLEPGLYRLTAYGGAPLAWSEDQGEQPLHLRWGVSTLGAPGQVTRTISPLGVDRFVVEGSDYFQLSLPQQGGSAAMSLTGYDPGSPFAQGGYSRKIDEDTLPPRVSLSDGGDGPRLLTLRGPAGQPYTLQHFNALSGQGTVSGSGPTWISTLHGGDPSDSLDATGMLVRRSGEREELVSARALTLGGGRGLERRFNLLGPASMLVEITELGAYTVKTEGDAVAELAVLPLGVDQAPPFRRADGSWTLDPGLYTFTLRPMVVEGKARPGIVTLQIAPPRGLLDRGPIQAAPLQAGLQWPRVDLTYGQPLALVYGSQPEVRVGLIQRPLPLDPSQPLPLIHATGEVVEVPLRTTSRGRLTALDPRGKPVPISVDGGPFKPFYDLSPGDHAAKVMGAGQPSSTLSLSPPEAPLPSLPASLSGALPDYPVLDAQMTTSLDLARDQRAVYKVSVQEPGLYRLESEGLLATEGQLRTRTDPLILSDRGSGTGRNFQLRAYLQQGDYQLQLQAIGQSAGHLGLRLAPLPMEDGGTLLLGVPARAGLAAYQGVAYRFTVTEEGDYRLRSLGASQTARVRLEDAEGWPLRKPGEQGDLVEHLTPGDYRLVVLPEPGAVRRITQLERVTAAERFSGHGPHPLAVGASVGHTWWEAPEGEERRPDVWAFSLSAPVDLTLSATEQMHGELRRGEQVVARLFPDQPWTGPLEAGDYTVELVNARRNNGVDYRLQLSAAQLAPGLSREVYAPATLPISVGERALVEVASFGRSDVKATLLDSSGRRVARSDDRPLDWNFAIQERLEPGRYQLLVEPVGAAQARTTVSVRAPAETQAPAAALPVAQTLTLGDGVTVMPLTLSGEPRLLTLGLDATETVGLSLEHLVGDRYYTVASDTGLHPRVQARTSGEGSWRLRAWSLDRRGQPVSLQGSAESPRRSDERALASGARLAPLGDAVAARFQLKRQGTLSLEAADDALRWCPAPDQACVPVQDRTLSPLDDALWLVSAAGRDKVRASRTVLSEGGHALVHATSAAPARLDLDGGDGALLVVATATTGQVGVSLDGGTLPGAVSKSAMVAVSLRQRGATASVWPAGEEPEVEAHLELARFALPEAIPAPWGALEAQLAPGEARVWTLPGAHRALHLGLEQGLVAALADEKGALLRVLWAGDGPDYTELGDAPARLYLFNPTSAPATAGGQLTLGRVDAPLSGATPWERTLFTAGTLPLSLAELPPPGTVLRAEGAIASLTLLQDDGRVRRGLELSDPGVGTLLVHHRPGAAAVWLDAPAAPLARWGEDGRGKSGVIELPAELDLRRDARFTLSGEGRVVHLRAPTPAVLRVDRPGAGLDISAFPERLSADLILPEGQRAEVQLRGLAGGALQGSLSAWSSPISALGEGAGPAVLLTPGATRVFRFDLPRDGTIGVGVASSAAALEATLLDAAGRPHGSGVVMMPTLKAGTWYLSLHLPDDAAPATARPALAGLEPPDTGPPEAVIRHYLFNTPYEDEGPPSEDSPEDYGEDFDYTPSDDEEAE
ncbi:MAG: hypothetical protein JXX28_17590 [Deltaproteobacteria bacterium]|nr:hypothetical protein [Deltaproteobacteria bacterium]